MFCNCMYCLKFQGYGVRRDRDIVIDVNCCPAPVVKYGRFNSSEAIALLDEVM